MTKRHQRRCWGHTISPGLPGEEIPGAGGQSISGRGELEQRPGENLCPEAWNLNSLAATDSRTFKCQAWGGGWAGERNRAEDVKALYGYQSPEQLNTLQKTKPAFAQAAACMGDVARGLSVVGTSRVIGFLSWHPHSLPHRARAPQSPACPHRSTPFPRL